jgi:hypothetical protein
MKKQNLEESPPGISSTLFPTVRNGNGIEARAKLSLKIDVIAFRS